MIKKLASVFALFFLATAVSVSAQTRTVSGFVEGQAETVRGVTTKTIDVLVVVPVTEKVSMTIWTLNSESWGEAQVGLSKKFTPWLSLSASAGIENAERPWRIGTSAWVGKGRVSTLFLYERGGSGWWYRSISKAKVGKNLSVGVHSKRRFGTGPYVEYGVGKVTLWSAPVSFGTGGVKTLSGLRVAF